MEGGRSARLHNLLQSLQPLAQDRPLWDRLMDAITEAYDGDIQMIDSSVVRVHQHAANVKKAPQFIVWAAPVED
jgi:hypothetical protein